MLGRWKGGLRNVRQHRRVEPSEGKLEAWSLKVWERREVRSLHVR